MQSLNLRTVHMLIPAAYAVIDCETGRFRMGLAADLARRMGAEHVPLEQVAAGAIVDVVDEHRARRPDGAAGPHRTDRRSAA